ncbi:hypothetical protein M23134_02519 [Microscilla marina ATCC 23134]|uniref:Uncharacterized protein n=2 Tax=Microscilla marina TaxID=1027 RepID=A1ZTT5_MICM2|nr:hypothetical protein M23134_02519 [Microscilla marina ATCC 23134]
MITAQQTAKPKTTQRTRKTQQKKTTRKTSMAKKSVTPKKKTPPVTTIDMADVFTSGATKSIVLLLIISFNVVVLRNSFLLSAPPMGFSGDIKIDALLYGLAISVLMVIILFHEDQWKNAFCPGAITLYADTLILILYMKWFEFILGKWLSMWLLSGLLIAMPVMGLFIMVIMLKK